MKSINEDSSNKWKFVILISKFIFHLIVASISKSFGVLIPELVVLFNTDMAVLGLVCSFPIAVMLFASPIVAHLLAFNRASPRVISLLGMFIGSFTLLLSSYTRSEVVLGVYMIVLGIGLAMGYMPFSVTLNNYYPNDFVVMNTLTEIGSSVGVMFIPLLIERCNRAYGYSGAMIIFSAIFFHLVAGSATLRPPRPEQKRTMPKNVERLEDEIGEREVSVGTLSYLESNKSNQATTSHGVCKGDRDAGDPQAIIDESKSNDNSQCFKENGMSSLSNLEEQPSRTTEFNACDRNCEKLELKENTPLGLLASEASDGSYKTADTRLTEEYPLFEKAARQTTGGNKQDICQTKNTESEPFHPVIRFFVDCIFIREPCYTLVLPVHFLVHVGTYAWMLYLVPHAEWRGIASPEAVLLSTISGVGALLGRVFLTIILYFGADPFVVCCISSIVAAATFLVDPWVTSYRFMCMAAFLQGWTLFLNASSRASMCKLTTSPEHFALGFGYAALASGIGGMTGCFAAGALYDVTQSFSTVFLFVGGIHILIVLNLLIYLLVAHVRENTSNDMT